MFYSHLQQLSHSLLMNGETISAFVTSKATIKIRLLSICVYLCQKFYIVNKQNMHTYTHL